MRELLAELTNALGRRVPCVYCAVVETRGSTPQKAGAAMLVYLNGAQAGTLGGGCVEAEVKRRALGSLNDGGRPEVLTFCLDEDYGWDDGLICGGRMTILAHPLTIDADRLELAERYYGCLRDLADRGEGFTEAIVIGEPPSSPGVASPGRVGDRYLFDATGAPVACLLCAGTPTPHPSVGTSCQLVPEAVAAHLPPLTTHARPMTRHGIAYLPAPPRVTVFLIGGGHVGQAVARLASEVGFDIWVLDDREPFASPERFPTARRRLVGDIGAILRDLGPTLTPTTYAVILTRGHRHDEESLYHLAQTACGYVGMIGSKRKIRLIFEDLVAKGVPAEALARVHAPLGYDIGSQTVPEIAVSIVAELIACRNKGTGYAARQSWEQK